MRVRRAPPDIQRVGAGTRDTLSGHRTAETAGDSLEPDKPNPGRMALIVTVVLACVLVGGMVWTQGAGPAEGSGAMAGRWNTMLPDLLNWIQEQGIMAALWLIALQALLVVLAIPGPFFTLGAGFLFGLAGGSLVAVAGSTVGAALAYGLARGMRAAREARAARRRGDSGESQDETAREAAPQGFVACWLAAHPRAQAAERMITQMMRNGDWKLVMSTRLVPMFPFKLSNYVFGWVRYPFGAFIGGTAVGLVPVTMVSVSVGALASDMSGLTNPALASGTNWMWSLAALVVGAIVLVWMGRRARASLRTTEGEAHAEGEP